MHDDTTEVHELKELICSVHQPLVYKLCVNESECVHILVRVSLHNDHYVTTFPRTRLQKSWPKIWVQVPWIITHNIITFYEKLTIFNYCAGCKSEI